MSHSSFRGILWLTSSSIILVHGLSGDERTTWQCGSMFWPDELLKEHGRSRVLVFAYDRNIWTDGSMALMETAAEQLIDKVVESRASSGVHYRPILWIAHSLGGCLVKAVWRDHVPTRCSCC